MKKGFLISSVALLTFLFFANAIAGSKEQEISLSDLKDKSISLQDLNPMRQLPGRSYDDRALQTQIRGYAVGTYQFNDNGVSRRSGNELIFGQKAAETKDFAFNVIEVAFNKRFSDWAWVTAAFDVESETGADGETATEASIDVGQISLMAPVGNGIIFSLGKFNSPVSFEREDAPLMLQASHSLAFQFGSPEKMTGLLVYYPFAINLDVKAVVFNGWNQDGDNNDSKSLMFQVGYAPKPWLNTKFSYLWGAEQENNDGDVRQVVNFGATLTPLQDLIIGGEFSYGKDENLSTVNPGQDAEWLSGQATIHYDFTRYIGATIRYSFFDDKDGRPDIQDAQPRTMNEITFAPTIHISQQLLGYMGWGSIPLTQHLLSGLDLRFEYRYDWVNENGGEAFFVDDRGNKKSTRNMFIMQLVAMF